MKQLTALDNMFLGLEHGNQYMHVASLAIYDPATAPEGKVRFKQIIAHYASRLDTLKIFQRRLVNVPLGIDLPYWLDEGAIDLEYHIRHIALPHPGDWRQLMIQIARLHSRALDLKRPPWEIYVIEGLQKIDGLPDGCFAVFSKFHHALIDGETGAEVIRLVHDLSPINRHVDRLNTYIADRAPSTLELLARAVGSNARRFASNARTLAALGASAAPRALEFAGSLSKDPQGALAKVRAALTPSNPVTRFAGDVSPHRVVTGTPLSLAGFQAIRAAIPGITINDIFLAVTGGAVRDYLQQKGELPSAAMTASVPVSTHGKVKSTDQGNNVAGVITTLATDIADPTERLHAIHTSMEKAKRMTHELGQDLMRQVAQLLPQLPVKLVQRHVLAPMASVVVSNVRGPDVPLYLAGARLVRFLPVSIATNGIGLNVTGFSYDGQLWVCVVSCREMMPDPDNFTACLQRSFDELLAASAPPTAARRSPTRGKDSKAQRARH